ncbi:BT_3928 family protein [Saccharicrinis sp. GN24d3]|uniref:BT_3928 family protein n=1 Tax=Saccharicrinis sp. GN24d3 TaxID=3458416 RepID=UPI004036C04D
MPRFIFVISRILVGVTFIFSGFVKAVDPTGSAIKFNDYLSAFGMEYLSGLVIPAAFILAALEFLTGLHLLLGIRVRTSSVLVLVFMAIFAPLTLFIAIKNPVTDCGCFGDALKLSNWETFFKNVILTLPTLYLFINRHNYKDNIKTIHKLVITLVFTGTILGVSYYSLEHLPIIDFRPFKIGNNINEGMLIPEGAEQPEYETTFILEKDGVEKTFTVENYPYTDTTWVFVSNETKVIKEGYEPPIHDFVLNDSEGTDQAQNILNSDVPVLLVVSYQINKGAWNEGKQEQIVQLKNALYEQGIKTYFLTSSSDEEITKFEFDGDAGFDYLNADETMLKTVIRCNPGLVLLQKGNVVGKWHYNDLPAAYSFKNPIAYSLSQMVEKQSLLLVLCLTFASLVFITVFMRKNK